MEFLDPKKLRAHQIRLMIGYVLVAIAITLAAVVLLYQANGFGVRQGKVIQNGLVFVESSPGGAAVNLNNEEKSTTNARLVLEAGTYVMKLTKNGYQDWQRALTIEGGSVEHFTYPYLIPKELKSTNLATYQAQPQLVTSSPDRRWMLVAVPGQTGSFDSYDLRDPERVQASRLSLSIPASVYGLPTEGERSLEVVDWSNDNEHIVLLHRSGDQSEYLLFSRKEPAASVNLTRNLGLAAGQALSLQDKKHDRYFVHDTVAATLSTVSLSDTQKRQLLTGVLAYKTYGTDTVLYTSPLPQQTDRVQVRLYQGKKQYALRTIATAQTYMLALSRYDGAWLAMAADAAEGRTYIYKDAAAALQREPLRVPAPIAVLRVANPLAVSFSANSQLMLAQSGNNFAVYDAEYDRSHTYTMDLPLDAPQTKAVWMDGFHLQYVSGGKMVIFDYDGTNVQTLIGQAASLPPIFNTGYTYLYNLAKPTVPGAVQEAHALSATPMRTAEDL